MLKQNKPNKLGQKVKYLMALRGETIFTLAAKTGLHYTMISHITNGRRVPSIGTVEKLAKALNITVSALMDDDIRLLNERGDVELLAIPTAKIKVVSWSEVLQWNKKKDSLNARR